MQSRDSRDGQAGSKEAAKGASLPAGDKKSELGKFEPGDLVGGNYEIIEAIGRGAMGFVYRAKHTTMNAEYALKVLAGEQLTDVSWKRFQNEAQAIGRLQHPNIVGIYNFGLHNQELPFYVMELLDGDNLLDKVIEYGPAPWQQALPMFVEVCAALGYAHRKGIVHRDVKPGNIIVLNHPDAAGAKVKVVDFGIVKFSEDANPNAQKLTSMGEVCGSPTYMAPEQAAGDKVDPRSDIYSLGISLFETLTGNLPFKGRNAVETMLMHQTGNAPTLKAASGGIEFPENLEKLVAKMMAKAPMNRYQNMDALANDLKAVLEGRDLGGAIYVPSNRDTLRKEDFAEAAKTRKLSLDQMSEDEEASEPTQSRYGSVLGVTTSRRTLSFPVKLAIGLGAITVLTAAGLIAWNLLQSPVAPKKAPQKNHIDSNKSEERNPTTKQSSTSIGQDKGIRNNQEISNDKADHQSEKMTASPNEDFLGTAAQTANHMELQLSYEDEPGKSKTDTAPYSHFERRDQTDCIVFQFPTDCIIGSIHEPTDEHGTMVQGSWMARKSAPLTFLPGPIAAKYPQYLKRFRKGEILCAALLPVFGTDEAVKASSLIPGVKELKVFDAKQLTKKCIPYIETLKDSLSLFDWSNSSLDGADLAKANCWNNLEQMYMNYSKNVSPMIVRLASSKKLRVLSVSGCKLSKTDIRNIAAIKSLRMLNVSKTRLTSSDLAILSTLPSLQTLELVDCGLNDSSIPALKNFKSLKKLKVSSANLLPQYATAIAEALRGRVAVN